jgi:hypothetical protein
MICNDGVLETEMERKTLLFLSNFTKKINKRVISIKHNDTQIQFLVKD